MYTAGLLPSLPRDLWPLPKGLDTIGAHGRPILGTGLPIWALLDRGAGKCPLTPLGGTTLAPEYPVATSLDGGRIQKDFHMMNVRRRGSVWAAGTRTS